MRIFGNIVVLGPLFFLVFISNLGIDINQDITLILKYIDDTNYANKVVGMGSRWIETPEVKDEKVCKPGRIKWSEDWEIEDNKNDSFKSLRCS